MGIHKNVSLDLSLKSVVRIIHRGGLYVGDYGTAYKIIILPVYYIIDPLHIPVIVCVQCVGKCLCA